MSRRVRWGVFGLIAGAALGIVLVIGGTHGAAGESESEGVVLERASEQYFFGIPLLNMRGSREEVRAAERWWEIRLYTAGALVGGAVGLAVALALTRTRTDQNTGAALRARAQ